MPATPVVFNKNLMPADDEGGSPQAGDGDPCDVPPDGQSSNGLADGVTNEPLPMSDESTEVGMAQKGTSEDAIVRRETDV